MRIGLLSTANINRAILAGAAKTDRVDVVAVASRDAGRAEAYAAEHGIATAHGSYEALLADPDVDAVYISLPNGMHHEWTMRALAAGKHVLCEKPYTRHPGEAEEAFDAADAAGLVLAEAFMYRHHPQTATVARLVADGAIGRLCAVKATFTFPLHDLSDVRALPELDGGALMDVGCYCISGLRLVAGEPERARGEQVVGPSGVDVVFTGALAFADGVVGHFDCGFIVPRRAMLEVVGEEATILVPDPFTPRIPGIEVLRPGDEPEKIAIEPTNSYRLELENVSAAIRGEAPLLLGREDAISQARTIDELYRSADAPFLLG